MISRSSLLISSFVISFFIISLGLSACTSAEKKQAEEQSKSRDAAIQAEREAEAKMFTQLRPAELRSVVQDAVVYGFPLVVMDTTRQVERAPMNEFRHERRFPDASMTQIVNSNIDTLYSTAWLDLAKEPVVLSVPATGSRYYTMSILDAWSNVFASPGTRTTGNGADHFAIVGPGWEGQLPANIRKIQAPTNMVWIIGRTHARAGADLEAVRTLQNRYHLVRLSRFNRSVISSAGNEEVTVNSVAAMDLKGIPNEIVTSMDAQAFFSRLSRLMRDNPPVRSDEAMLDKLARIGVAPGRTVNFAQLPPEVRRSLDEAVRGAYRRVEELGRNITGRSMNGWVYGADLGSYGNNYEARASTAWSSLGANMVEDTLYPVARMDQEGRPLTGDNRYVLHFAKGQLPPTNGPWSLTVYNARGNFVANSLNRYAVGSESRFRMNRDGSLTLFVQADHPGKAKVANWLPAPRGEFSMIMRLYWPKQAVLNGEWQIPGVQRVRVPQRLTQKTAKK